MILLSTAWFPPVEWMHHFLGNERVLVEAKENFVKQTWRNRCTIASANGLQSLSIPLQDEGNKTVITEKKISYREGWQAKHWRAIESAYSSSPYFEYFEEDVKQAVFAEHEFLFDLNGHSIRTVLHILRLRKEIETTTVYEASPAAEDLRYSISPKEKSSLHFPEYYQVFKDRYGFAENLSVLDLLFNEGLGSAEYLRRIRK
jgi:hypothetical protein